MVPGYGNSSSFHWQSLWQAQNPQFRRVIQRDWETPIRNEWVETLNECIATLNGEIVLAAHSLGCATVVHWANQHHRPIRAALLVAPADVEREEFQHLWPDFQPMPFYPLSFKSIVIASSDDPYVSLKRSRSFARSWGSDFLNIGCCGHIATADGFGEWKQGKEILNQILKQQT